MFNLGLLFVHNAARLHIITSDLLACICCMMHYIFIHDLFHCRPGGYNLSHRIPWRTSNTQCTKPSLTHVFTPRSFWKTVGKHRPLSLCYQNSSANMVVSRSNESQRSPRSSLEVYLIGSTVVFLDIFCSKWCVMLKKTLHPGRFTWNLRIHPWKRKIIFQTIIFRFYVNLRGCKNWFLKNNMSLDKVTIQWQVSWTNSFLNLNLELRLWPKWPGQKEPWHLCNTRYIRIYYSSEYVISIHI